MDFDLNKIRNQQRVGKSRICLSFMFLIPRFHFFFPRCSCFMMLCSFLPCSSVNQPHGHMCPLPLQPPSHPRPTPRSSRSPEPGSLSTQRFPPSVLHVLMDMHQSQSQFIPTISFPCCVHRPFSMSASLSRSGTSEPI